MAFAAPPLVTPLLRVKNRFFQRYWDGLLDDFFGVGVAESDSPSGRAVVVVSHSGTIANMLYSHLDKAEAEVLKPRNASVIAIDPAGCLGMQHEGTLAHCKAGKHHEYFTAPQFEQFADGVAFQWRPPPGCLLLLVRHGIALSNVDKRFADGELTREGEASIAHAALHIASALQQYDIAHVQIVSSPSTRTQHSSGLLYELLGGGGGGGTLPYSGSAAAVQPPAPHRRAVLPHSSAAPYLAAGGFSLEPSEGCKGAHWGRTPARPLGT